MNDKILDLVLGQMDPGEAPDLEAALEADPKARAARASWTRLAEACAQTFDVALDAGAADRVAARVVQRVRDEEARAARTTTTGRLGRRAFWARVLGCSLAAHAAVFGVLAWIGRDPAARRGVDPYVVAQWNAPGHDGEVAMRDDPLPPAFGATPVDETLPAAIAPREIDDLPQVPDVAAPIDPAAAGRRVGTFAFRARTNDAVKSWIEERVGARGSLETIRRSLAALASTQLADGSFPAPAGVEASDATALAILPFLGDGHCSRFGAQRDVVARAVAFLRAQRTPEGGLRGGDAVLWALSEDVWLASALMTLPEARERATELRGLVERTAPRVGGDPAMHALALVAAARARIVEPQAVVVPAGATVDGWLGAPVDPGTAVDRGTAILATGNEETFRRWTTKAAGALRALVGDDGFVDAVAPTAPVADRIAATARAILGLQVPFRAR